MLCFERQAYFLNHLSAYRCFSTADPGMTGRMESFCAQLYLGMGFAGEDGIRHVNRVFSACNLRIESRFYLWLNVAVLLIRDEAV